MHEGAWGQQAGAGLDWTGLDWTGPDLRDDSPHRQVENDVLADNVATPADGVVEPLGKLAVLGGRVVKRHGEFACAGPKGDVSVSVSMRTTDKRCAK